MQTKTISEYKFMDTYAKAGGISAMVEIKLRINHLTGSYDICSTYHDEKFNFKNIKDLQLIKTLLELMKEANEFAVNELLKIN